MLKILLCLLMTLPLFASRSFAVVTEFTVKQRYGLDLTKAQFFLRYAFQRKYKRDWYHGTYAQRREFLMAYDRTLEKEEHDREMKERQATNASRAKQLKDRAIYVRKQLRDRQQMVQQRLEEKQYNDRQQSFTDSIRNQGQDLADMQEFVRRQQQDSMASRR